jgi:hypothetical protein
VERKSLVDLVASLTGGKLRYALAELAALPRAAVVVEDRYSQVFKLDRIRPAVVADGLAELQVRWANVPIVFCETRQLAEEWTYRFLAAAHAWAETETRLDPAAGAPDVGGGHDGRTLRSSRGTGSLYRAGAGLGPRRVPGCPRPWPVAARDMGCLAGRSPRLTGPGRMVAVTGQSPSPDAPRSLSVLEAVLERITYVNEDTGYTIARVATDRTGPDLLTVVGPLLGAQVGESLRLTGHWSSHPRYGRQFEVHGLGPKRTKKIADAWEEQKAIKEVMVFLSGVGVSTSLAVRIYKKYAGASITIVRNEPYRLASEVWASGSRPPTPSPKPSGSRTTARNGSGQGCSTPCRRPLTTGTATSRNPT